VSSRHQVLISLAPPRSWCVDRLIVGFRLNVTAMPTTTIRISRATRDLLMRARNEDFRGVPHR
jgi:hypothetical protein